MDSKDNQKQYPTSLTLTVLHVRIHNNEQPDKGDDLPPALSCHATCQWALGGAPGCEDTVATVRVATWRASRLRSILRALAEYQRTGDATIIFDVPADWEKCDSNPLVGNVIVPDRVPQHLVINAVKCGLVTVDIDWAR